MKAGQVTAYRVGGSVTVTAPEGVAVNATMPSGTGQALLDGTAAFGQPYAGTVSGRVIPAAGQASVTLSLPSAPAPATGTATSTGTGTGTSSGTTRLTAPSPDVPVPAGVGRHVPPGADRRR
ncbi:hypothetical protein ACFU5O_14445 [Streptomyces sp. NPDC057445]|uniref:hypothetical protein n=1 Tax=Streptomyces sp. NPDC057445 TaxID=3346136 RepID=UPI0036B12B56